MRSDSGASELLRTSPKKKDLLSLECEGHWRVGERLRERGLQCVTFSSAIGADMNLAVLAEQKNRHPVEGRQPFATVQDLFEHRRSVRHRAADDLQDIGGGGLTLQRFPGLVE
jgi:uncharacterized membrane-anchored protein